jgi:hypothetical protein
MSRLHGVDHKHGWWVTTLQWVCSKRSHHNRNTTPVGLKKITINISHHNRCPGRGSNRTPPRCRPRALLMHQPARCKWTRNKWYPMSVCLSGIYIWNTNVIECTDFCNVTLLCNRNTCRCLQWSRSKDLNIKVDVVTAYSAVRNIPRALNCEHRSAAQSSERVLAWICLLDWLRRSGRENVKGMHGKTRFFSYRVYFLIFRPPMANWPPFFDPVNKCICR